MNPWFRDDGKLRAGWRFLLALLAWYVANFLAIELAEALWHRQMRLLEAIYRSTTLLLELIGFALLLMAADQADEGLWRAMGLGRIRGWLRQAALGAAIGAALVGVAFLWIAAAGSAHIDVHLTARTFELGLVELFILATGAMSEEVMFRGYPLYRLLEATPATVAVVIMSVFFAVVHGENPHATKLAMVNTFAIAVLLCVAYLRTGALWLPWGIHFGWNTALGLVFGLPVSGLSDFAVIVKTQARGPRWVTGGAYGIEGSLVGTIVILLGFLPVILLTPGWAGKTPELASPMPADTAGGEWEQRSSPDQPPARRIQGG